MKTGKQVRAATLRSINARIARKSLGATKVELREALKHAYPTDLLNAAFGIMGVTMRTVTADQLNDLNYGLAWCRASGRTLDEYFATPWGQDTGTPEQMEAFG